VYVGFDRCGLTAQTQQGRRLGCSEAETQQKRRRPAMASGFRFPRNGFRFPLYRPSPCFPWLNQRPANRGALICFQLCLRA
jgi:hypothetical protein